DEADVVLLGGQCRRGTGQEGGLLLGEDQAGDVFEFVLVDLGVDDREVGVGVLGGDRLHGLLVGVADTDDDVVAFLGHVGQTLLLVGVGLTVVGFEVGDLHTECGVRPFQASVGGD